MDGRVERVGEATLVFRAGCSKRASTAGHWWCDDRGERRCAIACSIKTAWLFTFSRCSEQCVEKRGDCVGVAGEWPIGGSTD
jgi:hypothetical protein